MCSTSSSRYYDVHHDSHLTRILLLSTLHYFSELNQIASLTYNDITCDGIFELIEKITKNPLENTPLTIQKALIVCKHVLVYGSEKTVNHAYAIQHCFQNLVEFNTVLMTQQKGGALSFLQTLQGGGVDKGGPVREAASQLVHLMGNIHELRRLRIASASQDSLVPVGDDTVAFYTDEVRFQVLKRRMEAERTIHIQSNLQKSEGGFGAGYASKDGRAVVGAAHGIEEMIKMANLRTTKFSDDSAPRCKTQEEIILEELKAQADAEKKAAAAATVSVDLLGSLDAVAPSTNNHTTASVDLLDFGGNAPQTAAATGDLLDFGGSSGIAPQTTTMSDLLDAMPTAATPAPLDPFAPAVAYNAKTTTATSMPPSIHNNLLDMVSQNDPFVAVPTNTQDMNLMGMNMNATNMNTGMNIVNTNIGMSSSSNPMQMPGTMNGLSSQMTSMSLSAAPEDRFSALDALAATTTISNKPSAADAKNAEDRLLGFATTTSASTTPNYSSNTMGMGSMSMGVPPPPSNMIAPGSGQVAKAYGNPAAEGNNDDNPWVMGGSTGMGLGDPVGPEPSVPPPPPPPDF